MELNKYVHTLRRSLENHSRLRPNEQSVYPFSDQKDAITLPDGVAHTYMALIREYPPPPWTLSQNFVKRKGYEALIFYKILSITS